MPNIVQCRVMQFLLQRGGSRTILHTVQESAIPASTDRQPVCGRSKNNANNEDLLMMTDMDKPARGLVTALLLALGIQTQADTCAQDIQHGVALAQSDRSVMSLLDSHADASQASPLIQYSQQSSSINKPILGNYARLRLAAMALRDGDTTFAREQLSQIEQNSPAAVDAALLLAESYRRDGNEEQARAWLLRTAARFPGNPRAVSGLVLAGDDWRNQGAYAQALPLYNLALNKAAENLKALNELEANPDRLYRTMTNTVAGNSTTVMDQLVLAMVRDEDSQVLPATRKLMTANDRLRCLREEEKSLNNAIQHATARDLSNGAFRTAAKMEKAATEQEIDDLQRIIANAPNATDLKAQLVDAQERLQRLDARLNQLGSTALPAHLAARKDAMESRKAELDKDMSTARQQVRVALAEELPEMKRYYRNLAGEAQLGKAQLLQGQKTASTLVGFK